MKPIVTVGVNTALLGVLGLAIPEFTTNETKNVVTLGDLKVQATEPTSHSVPPILSGAAIIIGLVLAEAALPEVLTARLGKKSNVANSQYAYFAPFRT